MTEQPASAFSAPRRYASENILTSCIWGTKPASLVVESLGHDPAEFLRVFEHTAEDARLQLQIQGAVTPLQLSVTYQVLNIKYSIHDHTAA